MKLSKELLQRWRDIEGSCPLSFLELLDLVEEQQRKLNGQDIACYLLKDEIESLKSLLRRATLIARQVHKDAYNLAHYTDDWFKDLSQIDSTFQDKL